MVGLAAGNYDDGTLFHGLVEPVRTPGTLVLGLVSARFSGCLCNFAQHRFDGKLKVITSVPSHEATRHRIAPLTVQLLPASCRLQSTSTQSVRRSEQADPIEIGCL